MWCLKTPSLCVISLYQSTHNSTSPRCQAAKPQTVTPRFHMSTSSSKRKSKSSISWRFWKHLEGHSDTQSRRIQKINLLFYAFGFRGSVKKTTWKHCIWGCIYELNGAVCKIHHNPFNCMHWSRIKTWKSETWKFGWTNQLLQGWAGGETWETWNSQLEWAWYPWSIQVTLHHALLSKK